MRAVDEHGRRQIIVRLSREYQQASRPGVFWSHDQVLLSILVINPFSAMHDRPHNFGKIGHIRYFKKVNI